MRRKPAACGIILLWHTLLSSPSQNNDKQNTPTSGIIILHRGQLPYFSLINLQPTQKITNWKSTIKPLLTSQSKSTIIATIIANATINIQNWQCREPAMMTLNNNHHTRPADSRRYTVLTALWIKNPRRKLWEWSMSSIPEKNLFHKFSWIRQRKDSFSSLADDHSIYHNRIAAQKRKNSKRNLEEHKRRMERESSAKEQEWG